MIERIDAICDLLLGAAHADQHLDDREKETIRTSLCKLAGTELESQINLRIEAFQPKQFDLAECAAAFSGDAKPNKRKLIELVVGVQEADEVIDFDEDDYLKDLAALLGLSGSDLAGLALSYEEMELKDRLHALSMPPPPPGAPPKVK